MGKLTTETFNESCCDGGETTLSDMSCRSCGCDPGLKPKPWVCERHRVEAMLEEAKNETQRVRSVRKRKRKGPHR
jgi:hypothetical protein